MARAASSHSTTWQHPGIPIAREALGSSVEFVRMDVREISAQARGAFDVVLFLGVREPAAELRAHREQGDTSQNWWVPNRAAVLRMPRTVGFRTCEVVAPPKPPLRGRAGRIARRLRLPGGRGRTRLIARACR